MSTPIGTLADKEQTVKPHTMIGSGTVVVMPGGTGGRAAR